MDRQTARNLLETLRTGLPPTGYVRHFTSGRKTEIDYLKQQLDHEKTGALLLHANYGSGKSHLLKYIREAALEAGFAVSQVSIDTKNGIGFHRMDQVLGAVCRGIEIPGGGPGIHALFDRFRRPDINNPLKNQITNNRRWNEQELLASDIVFVALRAYDYFKREWNAGDLSRDLSAEPCEWLYAADKSKYSSTFVYNRFVEALRPRVQDPRDRRVYSQQGSFDFKALNYHNSWLALADLVTLAEAAGLKGLVLLFDEFEDTITNLTNITHQEQALRHLFAFCAGRKFHGMTFYAVTPDFVERCKSQLLAKRGWEIDLSGFDSLPTFSMSTLGVDELQELAIRIMDVHALAYTWRPSPVFLQTTLSTVVQKAANSTSPDRVRQAVRAIVSALDDQIEDQIEEAA
jgi:hypothetical protein